MSAFCKLRFRFRLRPGALHFQTSGPPPPHFAFHSWGRHSLTKRSWCAVPTRHEPVAEQNVKCKHAVALQFGHGCVPWEASTDPAPWSMSITQVSVFGHFAMIHAERATSATRSKCGSLQRWAAWAMAAKAAINCRGNQYVSSGKDGTGSCSDPIDHNSPSGGGATRATPLPRTFDLIESGGDPSREPPSPGIIL